MGLQVFTQDGIYLRNVPNAPPDLHDFFIREESDGEGGQAKSSMECGWWPKRGRQIGKRWTKSS